MRQGLVGGKRIAIHQLSIRQPRLRLHSQLVHNVGKFRGLDFFKNIVEEIRLVGGMVCHMLMCGSYAKVDSFEGTIQGICAIMFDRSRWATQ